MCVRARSANYTYGHSTFTPNVDVYASPITLKDIYIFNVSPIYKTVNNPSMSDAK
ncbi:hypothetical protein Syun_028472 [Stephania yunnanensis]|uniref:Uncharacterized protein n=1 Tax=Stephania yunnanensis TaxID=152371 RepID=A0AAP0EHF5_9MAGN